MCFVSILFELCFPAPLTADVRTTMVVLTKGKTEYGDADVLANEFLEAQDQVEVLAGKLRTSLAGLHALQDEYEDAVKKQTKTLRNLEKSVASVNKRKRASRNKIENDASPSPASTSAADAADSEVSDDVPDDVVANGDAETPTAAESPTPLAKSSSSVQADRVKTLRARLSDNSLQHLMPCSGGFFVELFLGTLNVRFMRKSERLQFKTGYERLKLKLAPGLVLLAVVCLLFYENRWLHMMLQLCLSWYYVTLAVRENILRVNGSNIKSWWIIHHYFTLMQCVLLLTWPNNSSYAKFRKSLHLFGLYNAVLQIFQTRYQMTRLYALRSLGMADEMDVVSSDSTQIHWSNSMALLIPLILLGQAMQALQAGHLMLIYSDNRQELQILMLSLLFAANFIGNFYTTCVVLHEKRTKGRRRSSAQNGAISPTGESKKDS